MARHRASRTSRSAPRPGVDLTTGSRRLTRVGAVAGLAVAAVVPGGPAFGDEIGGAVTDVQINADTTGYWDKLRLDMAWKVPDGSSPGDTFSLVLPEQLRMDAGYGFPLKNTAGATVATAKVQPDGRTVVFTLADYVEGKTNIAGNAWFEARWAETVEPGTTQHVTFNVGASTFTDTVEIDPVKVYTGPTKWHNWNPNPAPHGSLQWGVMVGQVTEDHVGQTLTITDTPGAGQQIDCDRIAVNTLDYLPNGKTKSVDWINNPPGVVCDAAGNTVTYTTVITEDLVGHGLQLTGWSLATGTQASYDNEGTVTLDGSTKPYKATARRTSGGGSGDGTTPKVSVGDYVWLDEDRDGVQDSDESGIKGVVLTVTGPDGKPVTDVHGNPVGPTTTDEDGKYTFADLPVLPAGQSYTVTVDMNAESTKQALAGLVPTTPGQGTPATDSSTGSATSTADLSVDGAADPTLDFGFHAPKTPSVSVGDYVWKDLDRDGLQESGEPGIPGVVLTVTGPDGRPVTGVDGQPVGPQTTDDDGKYLFDKLPVLPAGQSYTVTIDKDASADALTGLEPTSPGKGDDRGADSSTDQATSGDLTEDGAQDLTLDFGFRTPAGPSVSVGDFVWKDLDGDGVQDAAEPGIGDVVLTLTGPDGEPVTDVDGNPVGPVTTDADGTYTFDNLPPLPAGQHYTVTVDETASAEALQGLLPSPTGNGTPSTDSSRGSAESGDLTEDGAKDLTLDFGYRPPTVTVGDKVWNDYDKDGIQDTGEPGIKGVVLVLTGPDGKPVTDVTGRTVTPVSTGDDGVYTFELLPPLPSGQHYTVTIDQKASEDALRGFTPSPPGQGARDVDSSTGHAVSEDLTTDGAADNTLDFGFHSTVPTGVLPNRPTVNPVPTQVLPNRVTPRTDYGSTGTRSTGTRTRSNLAYTGSEPGVLAGLGAMLIGTGAWLTRRRRRGNGS